MRSSRRRSGSWHVTVHALSRLASRFQILPDAAVEARICRALTDGSAVLVTQNARKASVYEIPLLTIRVMVVCHMDTRTVVTVLDADRFYRSQHGRSRARKHIKGRPEGGEEE